MKICEIARAWFIICLAIYWKWLEVFKKITNVISPMNKGLIRENPEKLTYISTEIVDNLGKNRMPCKVEMTLPWPPTVNHYKKVGAVVKTKTGKIFQKRVNTMATMNYFYEVYIQSKMVTPPEWGRFARSETMSFEVSVYLYPPDKRRRDIDNSLKVLFDSLVHAKVIKDDSQITRLYVEKMDTISKGQVIVRIRGIE